MEAFQWNALRRGHEVAVHDPANPAMALLAATVAIVEVVPGRRRVNRLGLRVAAADGHRRIIWPTHLTAHLDPAGDPGCWRCEEIARTVTPTRQCGRCRATFPGDEALPVGAVREWWACPPCRAQLLGSEATAPPARAAASTGGRR